VPNHASQCFCSHNDKIAFFLHGPNNSINSALAESWGWGPFQTYQKLSVSVGWTSTNYDLGFTSVH
jgi:hypothetical protein